MSARPASIQPSRSVVMATRAPGAMFTNDDALAALEASAPSLFHGKGETQYDNIHVGLNSRLDTLQARSCWCFGSPSSKRRWSRGRRLPSVMPRASATVASASANLSGARSRPGSIRDRDETCDRASKRICRRTVSPPSSTMWLPHRQVAYRNSLSAPGGLPVSASARQDLVPADAPLA